MVAIPKNVMDLLAAPDAVKVIATVSADGQPHVIAAGTIGAVDPNTMMIGKVLTKVSSDNIKSGKKVAFLVTKGLESYSINAVLKDIQSSGPVYDAVNQKLAECTSTHPSLCSSMSPPFSTRVQTPKPVSRSLEKPYSGPSFPRATHFYKIY